MSRRPLSFVFTLLAALTGFAAYAQPNANAARGFDPGKVYQLGELDHLNVFNGNLIVSLPMGSTYRVSDALSYRMSLIYNGNGWDHLGGGTVTAIPSRFSNGGLGWLFTMGEVIGPNNSLNGPSEGDPGWLYLAPDGAERRFQRALHLEEQGTAYEAAATPSAGDVAGYTRDGTYLRLVRLGGLLLSDETDPDTGERIRTWVCRYQLEFPDGTRHTFTSEEVIKYTAGPPTFENEKSMRFRMTRIDDRFGNYVTVSYGAEDPSADASWIIADSAGRSHTVHLSWQTFREYGGTSESRWIVTSVELAAFDGSPATYAFNYGSFETISESCTTTHFVGDTSERSTTVRFLESLTLPDGTSYGMDYVRLVRDGGNNIVCHNSAGHLTKLTLPTGGRIEYEPGRRRFPTEQEPNGGAPGGPSGPNASSAAIVKRTVVDANGGTAVWSYDAKLMNFSPIPAGGGHAYPREMVVLVTDPLAQTTAHYFSVDFGDRDSCFIGASEEEYGMPFTRSTGTTSGTGADELFLSTETFAGKCATWTSATSGGCTSLGQCRTTSGAVLAPLRRTFVAYEHDQRLTTPIEYEKARNQRQRATRTDYLDDLNCGGVCFTRTVWGDFDGLGHYRSEVRTSNFADTPQRTATTRYNANTNAGTFTPGALPSTYMVAKTDPWLLELHDQIKTEQGTTTAIEERCFDRSTGFLSRTRTLAGAAASRTDLLVVFTNGSGNLTKESYFGGDAVLLPSSFATCTGDPGTAQYAIDHTYEYGTRKTSRYTGMAFDTLDLTLNSSTGFPQSSRDTADVETTYTYDDMGRLLEVRPAGEAWTAYSYSPAATPPSITVRQWANGVSHQDAGATPLTQSNFYFDGLGRLIQSKEQFPGGWRTVKNSYDLLGRTTSVSVPITRASSAYESGLTAPATTYEYDRFGRATRTTLPDGKIQSASFSGERLITRSTPYGTGTEVSVKIERFDGHGRLAAVTEKEQASAEGDVTTYIYDVGSRLAEVAMGDQHRYFVYDNRGFLTQETHPESGSTSYTYDAKGHIATRTTPVTTLAFTYDKAERVKKIAEGADAVKEFAYDRSNSGTDASNGKLDYAIRHNRHAALGGDQPVKETYIYKGIGGRVSEKITEVGSQTFTDLYTYDERGARKTLTYPTCAGCSGASLPARTVTNTYSNGFLTRVDGYTSASNLMTYHPNGLLQSLTHLDANGTNGPVYTQSIETTGMARPKEISVSGYCQDLSVTNPADRTVNSGDPAGLTVGHTGGTTFQWYRGASGDTSAPVAGQTSSTLDVPVTITATYWIRAGNGDCTVDSRAATVTVNSCAAPDATVTAPSNVIASTVATASVPTLAGATYSWSVTNASIETGAGTSSITFRAGCSGAVTAQVTVTASCGTPSNGSKNVAISLPSATVSGSATINQGSNTGLQAALTGQGPWTVTWSDGIVQTVSTSPASRNVSPSGTTSYSVTALADGYGCSGTFSGTAVITVIPPVPANVVATAVQPTQVSVSWTASGTIDSFVIERSSGAGGYSVVGSSPVTTFTDPSALADKAYLYRVRSVKAGTSSAPSAFDLATTVIFVDDPITTAMPPRVVHVMQLRTAVNAVRLAAGSSAATFTDVLTAGVTSVRAIHLTELRAILDAARNALGLPAVSSSPPLAAQGAFIRAAHINELRGGVR